MASFTILVKDEICQKSFNDCCQKALLSAFTRVNGKIIVSEFEKEIIIHSFHNRTTRLIYQLFKNQYPNLKLKITVDVFQKFKKPKIYNIHITNEFDFLVKELKLLNKSLYINETILKQHCIRAYIAAIFLITGSINSPATANYHLELQFHDNDFAEELKKVLLQKFNFNFKLLIRRSKTVLYLKKSNSISDFLKLIDCSQAVFTFEDRRISRELFNNINRFNNIDISNQQKILNAGSQQVLMIKSLKKQQIFNELSLKCQILANIRLHNSDASLLELGSFYYEKTGETISKSGVNHLIREIKKKYQESN